MDKLWKAIERRVAKFFGASGRTPLSGGNGKITRSDTLHPDLFIEVKLVSTTNSSNGWIIRWLRKLDWPHKLVLPSHQPGLALYVLHSTDIALDGDRSPALRMKSYPPAVVKLYRQTEEFALAEGKVPLIALAVKGKKGFWIVGQAGDILLAQHARAKAVQEVKE